MISDLTSETGTSGHMELTSVLPNGESSEENPGSACNESTSASDNTSGSTNRNTRSTESAASDVQSSISSGSTGSSSIGAWIRDSDSIREKEVARPDSTF